MELQYSKLLIRSFYTLCNSFFTFKINTYKGEFWKGAYTWQFSGKNTGLKLGNPRESSDNFIIIWNFSYLLIIFCLFSSISTYVSYIHIYMDIYDIHIYIYIIRVGYLYIYPTYQWGSVNFHSFFILYTFQVA